jgi:predicted DNA-binding transcriptional regulator YafY
MNRIDRLFAILLTLQHKRRVRAQDLARQFEISKRTIYRDLSALNQMGIPITALPGEGFELVEGYYIPPLMFNENEAVAVLLGLRLLAQQTAGSMTPNAGSALAKINVVLPYQVRARAETLTNIIGFITPKEKFNLDDPQLILIQKAIQEKRVLHLHYHGYHKEKASNRDVEPHQLFYVEGVWYLEAYCRKRKEMRDFRLSRIDKITSLNKFFNKKRTGKIPHQSFTEIKIRFDKTVVRWVHEKQHYGFLHEQETPRGVVMTYSVNHESEMTPWILSWGASAEVLSPKTFRKTLHETAQKLANLLT